MSSYREHALAGLIFTLPFIPSLFYLFFGLLGASIADMDHNNNNRKVYTMLVCGIVISVLLYFLDGSLLSGLIIVALALIFYFSRHRGFTHTIFGSILLSILFTLMILGFVPVFSNLSVLLDISVHSSLCVFIIMALLGYFVVSRRYLLLYILVLAVYLVFIPVDLLEFSFLRIFLSFFIGSFSHIILDLLTPAGLSLLEPFSKRKFHRELGFILIGVWIVASIGFILSQNSLFSF